MGKLIKYNTILYAIFLIIVYISKLNQIIINIGFFVLIIINTLIDLIITIKTKVIEEIEEAINTYITSFTFLSFCIIAIGLVIGKEIQEEYNNIIYTLTLPTTIAAYASKGYLQATKILKEKYNNKIKENIRILKKLLNIIRNYNNKFKKIISITKKLLNTIWNIIKKILIILKNLFLKLIWIAGIIVAYFFTFGIYTLINSIIKSINPIYLYINFIIIISIIYYQIKTKSKNNGFIFRSTIILDEISNFSFIIIPIIILLIKPEINKIDVITNINIQNLINFNFTIDEIIILIYSILILPIEFAKLGYNISNKKLKNENEENK